MSLLIETDTMAVLRPAQPAPDLEQDAAMLAKQTIAPGVRVFHCGIVNPANHLQHALAKVVTGTTPKAAAIEWMRQAMQWFPSSMMPAAVDVYTRSVPGGKLEVFHVTIAITAEPVPAPKEA